MSQRRLPSLNALKAFEAAARNESITRAAAELHVTQGAISHQVKALEGALGLKLFERAHQQVVLTEAGRDYLAVIRDALDRIALGTERLRRRQQRNILSVSVSPDFAAKWLACRLGKFVEQHPDIDLRIAATAQHADFASDDFDLAVRHGDGQWPGLAAVRLCSEQLFPVCSSALFPRGRKPKTALDLLKYPLLRLRDWSTWERWFQAAGIQDVRAKGAVLNSASMLIDAAAGGQGVALARTTLAAWDILNGRLVRPINVVLPLATAYWVVCPKASFDVPKIAAFRKWVLDEAGADSRKLKPLLGNVEGASIKM
jgi:LysR family glycine cleavage system transcriptional activator